MRRTRGHTWGTRREGPRLGGRRPGQKLDLQGVALGSEPGFAGVLGGRFGGPRGKSRRFKRQAGLDASLEASLQTGALSVGDGLAKESAILLSRQVALQRGEASAFSRGGELKGKAMTLGFFGGKGRGASQPQGLGLARLPKLPTASTFGDAFTTWPMDRRMIGSRAHKSRKPKGQNGRGSVERTSAGQRK